MGEAYFILEQIDSAKFYCNKVLSMNPNNENAKWMLLLIDNEVKTK